MHLVNSSESRRTSVSKRLSGELSSPCRTTDEDNILITIKNNLLNTKKELFENLENTKFDVLSVVEPIGRLNVFPVVAWKMLDNLGALTLQNVDQERLAHFLDNVQFTYLQNI